MSRQSLIGLLLTTILFGMGGVYHISRGLRAEEPRQEKANQNPKHKPSESADEITLRTFMRKKLAASNKILEGLATEDTSLVREGARVLNRMSTAEKWRVSTDPLYRQFSGEFRTITNQLIDAADDDNLDRSALKWMDAMMSCIECHRYVRGMHIANRID